jgi:hypothetical protein
MSESLNVLQTLKNEALTVHSTTGFVGSHSRFRLRLQTCADSFADVLVMSMLAFRAFVPVEWNRR